MYAILGMTGFFSGDLRGVVDPLDAAVESARLTGSTQALAWSLYARSKVALAMGQVDVALSTAQEAFDVAYDGRPSHRASLPAMAVADAHLHLEVARIVEQAERASASGP